MKLSKILVIAVLLAMAAAISAGCTGEGQSAPADDTPRGTEIPAETTATATAATPGETTAPEDEEGLKPGDRVSSATVTNNNYTWFEYRDNTTTGTPEGNIIQFEGVRRNEYSNTEYNGEPATLVKITYTSMTYGWSSVSEFYYDESRTWRFYGKIVTTRANEAPVIEEFGAEETGGGNSGYFGKDVMLTYLGTESVTVPAGTFPDAGKYSYYDPNNNLEFTYWFAPGIPVPVLSRFQPTLFAGCYGLESHELIAWG